MGLGHPAECPDQIDPARQKKRIIRTEGKMKNEVRIRKPRQLKKEKEKET